MEFLPADSSFCKGALADEQSIIMSIKPIAFAARLLSGPEHKQEINIIIVDFKRFHVEHNMNYPMSREKTAREK